MESLKPRNFSSLTPRRQDCDGNFICYYLKVGSNTENVGRLMLELKK